MGYIKVRKSVKLEKKGVRKLLLSGDRLNVKKHEGDCNGIKGRWI